jgi:hypothetical protein
MRILLDECVDQGLRHSFEQHECQPAGYAGLAGLKNGALLLAAEEAGIDVVVTADQDSSSAESLLAPHFHNHSLRSYESSVRSQTIGAPGASND